MIFFAKAALAIALAVEDDHGCEFFILIYLWRRMFQTKGSSAGLHDGGVGVVVVRVRVSHHQAMSALDLVLGNLTSYSCMNLEVGI